MANAGRFLCVALPFILTLLSLITLLIAALGGVTSKDIYMFQVNVTDLQVNPISIKSIISRQVPDSVDDFVDGANDFIDDAKNSDFVDKANDFIDDAQNSDVVGKAKDVINGDGGGSGSNITAADLDLADIYEVNLWGYCTHDSDDKKGKECTKAKFDWATQKINETLEGAIGKAAARNIEIPDEVQKGLDAFSYVTKWTEVAFIIALISLALQLFLGLFAQCSRAFSCVVFLVAGVSAVTTIAAASLSTAMSVVVVGTVESTAKFYGVNARFQTTFLGLVWTSVAFALGAAFFWMFTICCCAPDRTSRKDRKSMAGSSFRGSTDKEKLMSDSHGYSRINDPEMHGGNNPNYYQQTSYPAQPYGQARRSEAAYEPFSHR